MSGLYTALFGESVNSATLVHWLGLRRRDFQRFRDGYKTEAGEIAIYTRLGGGNRPDYQSVIDSMRGHREYIRDVDDSYDSTYCTFYFRCPVEHRVEFEQMASERDRDAMWPEKMAALETMPDTEMNEIAARVDEHVRVMTPEGSTMTLSEMFAKLLDETHPKCPDCGAVNPSTEDDPMDPAPLYCPKCFDKRMAKVTLKIMLMSMVQPLDKVMKLGERALIIDAGMRPGHAAKFMSEIRQEFDKA